MVFQSIEDVWPHAYRMARSLRLGHHDAEDLAQDIVTEWHKTPPRALLSSLLFARVKSRYVDFVRRRGARHRAAVAGGALTRLRAAKLAGEPTPALNLERLVASLPPKQRTVLELRMGGVPWEAIARQLGITVRAATDRWHRGVRTLQNRVSLADTPPAYLRHLS